MILDNNSVLEDSVRNIILDLCEVMYLNGYKVVSVGALMRLLGVDISHASKHDMEVFELDDEFQKLLDSRKFSKLTQPGSTATLH
jgi:hypothetical protein